MKITYPEVQLSLEWIITHENCVIHTSTSMCDMLIIMLFVRALYWYNQPVSMF